MLLLRTSLTGSTRALGRLASACRLPTATPSTSFLSSPTSCASRVFLSPSAAAIQQTYHDNQAHAALTVVPFHPSAGSFVRSTRAGSLVRSSLNGRRFFASSSGAAAARDANSGYYTLEDQQHYLKTGGDPSKRTFAYFVLGGGRFVYSAVVRVLVLKLIYTMTASADVLALASVEVDVSNLNPGTSMTVKWRGKPVFVRRRTQAEIEDAKSVNIAELRHPQTDAERFKDPELLVVIGVCTHLGCVPIGGQGEFGGWFCPCHGSHYDISGRIRKGPAPENLPVPEYKMLSPSTILIG